MDIEDTLNSNNLEKYPDPMMIPAYMFLNDPLTQRERGSIKITVTENLDNSKQEFLSDENPLSNVYKVNVTNEMVGKYFKLLLST